MTDDTKPRGKDDPDACEHYPGQEPCNSDPGEEHTTKEHQ